MLNIMSVPKYLDRCPIGCDSDLKDTDIILPEGCLKECSHCGQLISQCSEQSFENSMEEFNDPNGTWPTPKTTPSLIRNTRKILKEIETVTGKDRGQIRLLDVGCSNGAFIHTANTMGMNCEGVEPAQEAAQAAQESGLKVTQGFLEEVRLPDNSFDVITIFEVIEHLKDPLSLLKECKRLLKPAGILGIRTGNTDSWTVKVVKEKWHYFNIDKHGGHISFFNKRSMSALAQRAGFTVEHFQTYRVSYCEQNQAPYLVYRLLKVLGDLSNLPAKLTDHGHEMRVYLKNNSS
jgi:2-polyprenyl-3-methyl-5-hydroxy-6-metoxy-1,4-benzoquinol methylase